MGRSILSVMGLDTGAIGHFFFFSSRRRHTRFDCDWSSDVCSSDLGAAPQNYAVVYVVLLPYALFRWGSGREMVIGSAIIFVRMTSAFALGYMSLGQS